MQVIEKAMIDELKLSDLQAHFKMEKVKQAEFVKTIFI
jgi:hypothetical protein